MNARPARQCGSALVVTLVLLAMTMLLGVAAAQVALLGERGVRNDRDYQVALQAAEAALLDAETDIENATGANSRSANFAPASRSGFPDDSEAVCANGLRTRGLCRDDLFLPAWAQIEFNSSNEAANPSVPYGAYTGASLPVAAAMLPARLPRYIIELKLFNRGGAAADNVTYLYRVTALGFGVRASTSVMLQEFYRKEK